MASLQQMLKLEQQHLDANVRSSPTQLSALLCDTFREIGASGKVSDRANTLESVTSESVVTEYKIDDYHIEMLGNVHILATYTLSERRATQLRLTLRSSIWKQVNNQWCLLFHQGTRQAE